MANAIVFQAGEARWFGTDEDEFTKVLATRSYLQLRIVFLKYFMVRIVVKS